MVECNEAFMEPLFNEELWHEGTLVKEFLGAPHSDSLHSTFPERGYTVPLSSHEEQHQPNRFIEDRWNQVYPEDV